MVNDLPEELQGYQWELPLSLEIPPDKIKARLDFYQDSIFFYLLKDKVIQTKMISARDLTMALLREVPMSSGLLPQGTLWWRQNRSGPEFALWRPPGVWKVALQLEAFKPPRRFKLPMPGLIFICSPGRQPKIYAAKKRPTTPRDFIYHAPLFNIFDNGSTCAGTHKFPPDVGEIPESFFTSFFTKEAQYNDRSKKYPKDLLKLWEELDGKTYFPLKDLVRIGTIKDIL